MTGLADIQERMADRQAEREVELYRKRKVCGVCGWLGVTTNVLCWNIDCAERGVKKLEVAE